MSKSVLLFSALFFGLPCLAFCVEKVSILFAILFLKLVSGFSAWRAVSMVSVSTSFNVCNDSGLIAYVRLSAD